ncbi:MAG: hypothetical protein B7Y43_12630 [Sphingomonas sp. 28-62-20]|uniref:hypothetical protein n=1 Tax=Sphingomonas sp. 28-62-20 TaxID=1970433 RepID=UPI000BC87208|nr:MAG: hypothetical protein B7Y43_12630 [Sphingomonas sp. 28-62-20]
MFATLIRHFLLLAVVIGLAGQGVAHASAPCDAMMKAQASPMAGMTDCDAMAGAGKNKAPCKDMTAGCFAMAGCSTVAAIDTHPDLFVSPMPMTIAPTWPATPVLTGREIAPDPDPPSLLG